MWCRGVIIAGRNYVTAAFFGNEIHYCKGVGMKHIVRVDKRHEISRSIVETGVARPRQTSVRPVDDFDARVIASFMPAYFSG